MTEGPPRRALRGLRPLRSSQRTAQARDAEIETRLGGAWSLVVGEALASRTRLLRVRRGILVVGAWDLASIQALRQAAAAAWPEVRARVRRLTNIDLAGLDVEPCDAPDAGVAGQPGKRQADPLKALLVALKRKPRLD